MYHSWKEEPRESRRTGKVHAFVVPLLPPRFDTPGGPELPIRPWVRVATGPRAEKIEKISIFFVPDGVGSTLVRGFMACCLYSGLGNRPASKSPDPREDAVAPFTVLTILLIPEMMIRGGSDD